jgi:predicted dehydrogenase
VTVAPGAARPLRALIVGLGSIGQRHARNLRSILGDDVELLALRARGRTHVLGERMAVDDTATVGERLRVRELTSIDDALAAMPDVAFICNPTRLHVPVAQRLADAGCHLFLEKPIADSMDGVDDLARTVERRGIVAVVGCQMRFHPCLRRLHALLAAGAVGTVTSVRIAMGEYLPGWHPYEDYRESYAARRDLGGGVILTLIHELDYAYWLFGVPARLFAVGGHLSNLEIDVDDTASILMQCRTRERPLPVHVQMDFVQRPPARSCEVVGDGGKIIVDLVANSLCAYDAAGMAGEELRVDFERNQLFLDELTHFLACVRGEDRPLVPLADGIATLRMALAARESIATGQLVNLA